MRQQVQCCFSAVRVRAWPAGEGGSSFGIGEMEITTIPQKMNAISMNTKHVAMIVTRQSSCSRSWRARAAVFYQLEWIQCQFLMMLASGFLKKKMNNLWSYSLFNYWSDENILSKIRNNCIGSPFIYVEFPFIFIDFVVVQLSIENLLEITSTPTFTHLSNSIGRRWKTQNIVSIIPRI